MSSRSASRRGPCWLTILVVLSLGAIPWAGTSVIAATSDSAPSRARTSAATSTITVNSAADAAADDGLCTLREAIAAANSDTASGASSGECAAGSGTDTIAFAIGALGSQQTITPTTNLPTITAPVVLDAWTQGGPDYTGPPLIELDGSSLNASSSRGFRITGGGTTVRGFAIHSFDDAGSSAIWLHTADGNWIAGNTIGLSADGAGARPNTYGIWLNNRGNTQPSGNNIIGTNGDGVGDAFESNVIAGNIQENIRVETSGNWIAGNSIGTNAAGNASLGANNTGVRLYGNSSDTTGDGNTIGTNGDGVSDALEGNLISGQGYGIGINNSSDHVIAGNIIGLDTGGSLSVANSFNGIECIASATDSRNILIEGNVISGNGGRGYSTFDNNCRHITIRDNRIGTSITGTLALGNGAEGTLISAGDWYTITGNLISGNGTNGSAAGISVGNGANNIAIIDNAIGSDVNGTADLGNTGEGIEVSFSDDATIRDNQISGNGSSAVLISSGDGVLVQDNLIGVQGDGTTELGNDSHGIYILGNATGSTVASNTIAYNGGTGVIVDGSQAISNTISANAIFENGALGIDLGFDGVTLNDPGDADAGPNSLQNWPTISSAVNARGILTVTGLMTTTANTAINLELFSSDICDPSSFGEGQAYLGNHLVTTDGAGEAPFEISLPVTIPGNRFITATATDPDSNTSEFSQCSDPTPVLPDIPISGLKAGNNGPIRFTEDVTLHAAVTEGTNVTYFWDVGDGSLAKMGDIITHTYGASGTYTATVTAVNNAGTVTATTDVSVLPAGAIYGQVWYDEDADGYFGLGEAPATLVNVAVEGAGSYQTSGNGTWNTSLLSPGIYTVTVQSNLTGYRDGTYVVPLLQDGFLPLDAPLQLAVTTPGTHRIAGRVWADINGDGLPNPSETAFSNRPVTLGDGDGTPVQTAFTASDGYFLFSNLQTVPADYVVETNAPTDHTPDVAGREVVAVDQTTQNAHLPLLPIGSIAGQVTGPFNSQANLTIELTDASGITRTTATDSEGVYRFDQVAGGYYKLAPVLNPSDVSRYQIVGEDNREIVFNGGAQVENWELVESGTLRLITRYRGGRVSTPIGGVPIRVTGEGGYDQTHTTGPYGAVLVFLEPGTFAAEPLVSALGVGAVADPARRNVLTIVSDTGPASTAQAQFDLSLPQALLAVCRSAGGNAPFACGVEVRQQPADALIINETLATGQAERLFALPDPGTYEVTLRMLDPAYPGWPDYSKTIVANAETPLVEVGYGYSLSRARRRVSGYAFRDDNGNGMRDYEPFVRNERRADTANGLNVRLLDTDGQTVATTTTYQQDGANAGYYVFDDIPFGDYLVEIVPPEGVANAGFLPTTPTSWPATVSPEPGGRRRFDFGFVQYCQDCVAGRAYIDDGDRVFDVTRDTPLPGLVVTLEPAAGPPVTATTGSQGLYRFTDLSLGQDLIVRLDWPYAAPPPSQLEIPISLEEGVLPQVDWVVQGLSFAPQARVFFDTSLDTVYQVGENQISGITLELFEEACTTESPTPSESQVSQPGGVAFAAVLPLGGCLRVDETTLPEGVQPLVPEGIPVPPLSGNFVDFPVVNAAPALRVIPFWDRNANGGREGNEPVWPDPVTVVVNGTITRTSGAEGAMFYLPPGDYRVMIVAPSNARLSRTWSTLGESVTVGDEQLTVLQRGLTYRRGFRVQALHDRRRQQPLLGTVEIRNVATGATVSQRRMPFAEEGYWDLDYGNANVRFFGNLLPGTYRVTASDLPPGYEPVAEPVITIAPNDAYVPVDLRIRSPFGVTGRIYWDGNLNGRRDSNEGSPTNLNVALLSRGSVWEEVQPGSDSLYSFDNLPIYRRFAVTVPDLNTDLNSITESPGWFTLETAAGSSFDIGIAPFVLDDNRSYAIGRVEVLWSNDEIHPLPGATVGYFRRDVNKGCAVLERTILGTTTADLNGDYRLGVPFVADPARVYCVTIVDTPRVSPLPWSTRDVRAALCEQGPGGIELCQPRVTRSVDLLGDQSAVQQMARHSLSGGSILWEAFVDANGNGMREDGEPPLADVILRSGTVTMSSDLLGAGTLTGLAEGPHTVELGPPAGFLPLWDASALTVWLAGSPLRLRPIPFRQEGVVTIQVFADYDGDGRQGEDEPGVAGATVALTGPQAVAELTNGYGRYVEVGLPDGTYTLSVSPPTGYATVPDRQVALSEGGFVTVPLAPEDLVSGVVYEDWDGDGARDADEAGLFTPITVTLGVSATRTIGGRFAFLDTPTSAISLTTTWGAARPATVSAATGIALGGVDAGTIRGRIWLDANGDGLRQPWEAPLSGITLGLDGTATIVSDGSGRFSFTEVGAGPHLLSADLPQGLEAILSPVTLTSGRGLAVGIPVSLEGGSSVYLPLVIK